MAKAQELIEKVLQGYASSEEKERLMLWRLSSDKNEVLFQMLYNEFHFVNNTELEKMVIPDKDSLWCRILRNTTDSPTSLRQDNKIKRFYHKSFPFLHFKLISTFAAVLVIGFLLATLLFYSPLKETKCIMQTDDSRGITAITLNDGSNVWLNRGTVLSYTNNFGHKTRNVHLNGEAYFDIKQDKKKPFTVTVRGIKVKVLGTAFNVKSVSNSGQIEVTLDRGKVSLFENESSRPLVVLSPHEKAILNPSNHNHYNVKVMEVSTNDENLWRAESVILENVTAKELIYKLEKRFGVNINTINQIPTRHFWFTIRSESLSEVLKLINKITPIIYKIDGKEVRIRFENQQ